MEITVKGLGKFIEREPRIITVAPQNLAGGAAFAKLREPGIGELAETALPDSRGALLSRRKRESNRAIRYDDFKEVIPLLSLARKRGQTPQPVGELFLFVTAVRRKAEKGNSVHFQDVVFLCVSLCLDCALFMEVVSVYFDGKHGFFRDAVID